jgi:hypothetical protein
VVVLLVLAVPFVILVLLLAMEWLEFTLLDSHSAHRSGDALLAWHSSAVDTGSTVAQAGTSATATRGAQAFAG